MSEERHKINQWDQTAVKQLLDDVTMETVLNQGYEEDNSVSNIKLVIGVIACSFALLSHFYPLPFPNNMHILKFCCIGYFICSGILQYVVQYIEKDNILVTKNKSVRKGTGKALIVSTSLPKYDDNFTICIGAKGQKDEKQITKSIASWFDTEGGFAEEVFVKDVQQLIADVEKSN